MYSGDFSCTNSKGYTVRGRFFFPGETGKYTTLVFGHGFGSNWQELAHYGPLFAENGLGIVLFDFCGGGLLSTSDGSTTEMSVVTEEDDLLAVLDRVKTMPQADAEKLFAGGESQGGYVAALAAARHPETCAGLVLWYPAIGIGKHAQEMRDAGEPDMTELWDVPLGQIYTDDALKTDIYAEIKGYDRPVLLVQGNKDIVVPPESSKDLAENYYTNARLEMISGGGHGFNGHASKKAARRTMDFLLSFS
ncbi:MAG: alpha/beta hydrolase [Eubacterium sp.]|nr:alpha/beta hydrolase [Eubacterium sp.]